MRPQVSWATLGSGSGSGGDRPLDSLLAAPQHRSWLRWDPYARTMARRSPARPYLPCEERGGRSNVVAGGSPADGTLLCLSHWPGIGSPAEFAADLSAQMGFRSLRAFDTRHGA